MLSIGRVCVVFRNFYSTFVNEKLWVKAETIFENNRKWVEKLVKMLIFKKCKKVKSEYLYIGCSDSRAAAEEEINGHETREVLCIKYHQLVEYLDMNSTAVIQYAVQHLKEIKHIIVCGKLWLWWCKKRDDASRFWINESMAPEPSEMFIDSPRTELDANKRQNCAMIDLIELNVQRTMHQRY